MGQNKNAAKYQKNLANMNQNKSVRKYQSKAASLFQRKAASLFQNNPAKAYPRKFAQNPPRRFAATVVITKFSNDQQHSSHYHISAITLFIVQIFLKPCS